MTKTAAGRTRNECQPQQVRFRQLGLHGVAGRKALLTTSPANDARAVWTADSKQLMWNSGIYGFKDEAALHDNTFQPYGEIFIMNADARTSGS